MMSRGCLDIVLSDSVLEACQSLSSGEHLQLPGVNVEQSGMSNAEEITIVADRQHGTLTFRLFGSSMGSIFNRKLSAHWKCDITSISSSNGGIPDGNEGLVQEITSEIDRAMGNLPEIPVEHLPHIEKEILNNDTVPFTNDLRIAEDVYHLSHEIGDSPAQNYGENLDNVQVKTEILPSTSQTDDLDLKLECSVELQRYPTHDFNHVTNSHSRHSTQQLNHPSPSMVNRDEYPNCEAEGSDDTEEYHYSDDDDANEYSRSNSPDAKRFDANENDFEEDEEMEDSQATASRKKPFKPTRRMSKSSRSKRKVCPICGKNIYSRLSRHIATHEKPKVPRTRRKTSTKELKVLKDKPYFCEQCGRTVIGNIRFKDHVRSHKRSGEQCACTICGKLISTTHFREHARTHTGEKPYSCTVCDRHFATSQSLKTHMVIHTGDKKYRCTMCDLAFAQKVTLQGHLNWHTGDRPYRCEICGKGFAKQSMCSRHSRVHTDYRPHPCTSCDLKFKSAAELRAHNRIHTGEKRYKCNVCSREFRHFTSFQIHTRTHTGEKPFHCSTCGKDFRSKTHLNRHVLIHTGEKPYRCSQCEASYNQNGCLKRHMLKYHS